MKCVCFHKQVSEEKLSRVDELVSLQKNKVTNCDLVALCTLVIAIERTDRNENPKSKVKDKLLQQE